MQDSIQWVAIYDDGILHQIDHQGTKHAYEDIDRERIRSFSLIQNNKILFRAHFNGDGKKLIWRRRIQKTEGEEFIVHIVGKKHQYVACVFQDGTVGVYDNFREDLAMLVPPVPVKGEE